MPIAVPAALLVAVIVIVRAKALGALRSGELAASEEFRPTLIPAAVRDRFIVRAQAPLLGLFGLAIALVIPIVPFFDSLSSRFDLIIVIVMAVASVSLTMLVGWSGQGPAPQWARRSGRR